MDWEGSSQARSAIQREIAGWDFFVDDAVVRLEVDTVEATEVVAVVRVFGIAAA